MKDQLPRLRSASAFVDDFWQWWSSLQPDDRAFNPDVPNNIRPTSEMGWTKLDKPGRNGFLLVMVQLTWWGNLLGNEAAWLRAVKDVTSVLRCLGVDESEGNTLPSSIPGPAVKRKTSPLASTTAANKKAKVADTQPPRTQPPRTQPSRTQPSRTKAKAALVAPTRSLPRRSSRL